MSDRLPDGLTAARNLELRGRAGHMWYRRVLLGLIAVFPVLALLNVFGQHPQLSIARASAGVLKVSAPSRLRGGLIFQVRTEATARDTIAKPQLVFSRAWWESMSVNSIEPDPSSQGTQNGSIVLTYNRLPAGHTLVVWIYFQANPDNAGRRIETVDLQDGPRTIARIHRSLTIFP